MNSNYASTTAGGAAALRLDSITAGYGSATVLRDVTLVVPGGSVVALLGANGAGKTTLLRVASGLIRPSSGRIVVGGEDLTGRRPHVLQRAGICHIPEGRGVFRNLTVRDNLELHANGGDRRIAVERAVEAFPVLGKRIGQLAGTMSGGEQQMLALARAYVQNPPCRRAGFVLLDEVSMGLAPLIVDEIFDFLTRLAAQGTSLLLVEQYVTRALAAADYVYVLARGRVSFAGDPGELDEGSVFEQYLGTAAGG
jgi:branched-chain amino acid transport system ATP-binding protein